MENHFSSDSAFSFRCTLVPGWLIELNRTSRRYPTSATTLPSQPRIPYKLRLTRREMAFHDLKHFGILLLFWLLHRTDAKSANSTTLGSGFADLTINVGNGLVDIAALTTLIGSSTAESLVLGDRGYAGLPWAAASAFGMISVIKGCIAGASPGWLRDTFGVRNGPSDGALGMSLLLDKGTRRDERVRQELPTAVGITCKVCAFL